MSCESFLNKELAANQSGCLLDPEMTAQLVCSLLVASTPCPGGGARRGSRYRTPTNTVHPNCLLYHREVEDLYSTVGPASHSQWYFGSQFPQLKYGDSQMYPAHPPRVRGLGRIVRECSRRIWGLVSRRFLSRCRVVLPRWVLYAIG